MATSDITTPLRCSKCRQEYPPTLEYFKPDKAKLNGLCSWCKNCTREKSRQYYAKNAERLAQYARDRRKNEPEKVHAEQKAGRKRNHDKILERNRKYRAANPDKVRVMERRYGVSKKGKARTHRRYAREHNLPNDFTADDWLFTLEYWEGCCAVCGRPQGLWHKLVPDHWIALKDTRPDNPGTVPGNMLPLCHGDGGCNNSKVNLDPVAWLTKRLGNKKAQQKLKEIEVYFSDVRRTDGQYPARD